MPDHIAITTRVVVMLVVFYLANAAQAAPTTGATHSKQASQQALPEATVGSVQADEGTKQWPLSKKEKTGRKSNEPLETLHKRTIPDFHGADTERDDAVDHLLWVPRFVFLPLSLTSEYVVRRPIGWLITEVERNHLVDWMLDVFTWNNRNAGLVPTFLYDFGLLPSVGFYFFWNDFLFRNNYLRMNAGAWGVHWLNLRISDRIKLSEGLETGLALQATRRPDQVYQGVGYGSLQSQRTRFSRDRVLAGWYLDSDFLSLANARYTFGAEHNRFGDSDFEILDDSRPLEQGVVLGWFPLPDAYIQGYTVMFHRLDAKIDTSQGQSNPRLGGHFHAWGKFAQDIEDIRSQWVEYGAEVGVFMDLWDHRILRIQSYVDFARPAASGQIPFTELVDFDESVFLMAGFLPGTLRGQSGLVLTLEYTWPVWIFVEGVARAELGNAFGEDLEDFHWKRMRSSFAFGLRSIGDRDNSFMMLIAAGSETIENGMGVVSGRFVFGTRTSF